jgi:hypothetical protein
VNRNSADSVVADFSKIDTVHKKNWYCSNKIGTVHLTFSGKNQNQAGLIFSAHGILNTASTSSVHDAPSKLGDLTLTW